MRRYRKYYEVIFIYQIFWQDQDFELDSFLRAQGYRLTSQRRPVRRALAVAEATLQPQESPNTPSSKTPLLTEPRSNELWLSSPNWAWPVSSISAEGTRPLGNCPIPTTNPT